MNAHFLRATMLIEQSRFDLAVEELRKSLAQSPEHAQAHSLLAICLAETEQFKEASQESKTAIELSPDAPYNFYAASLVSASQNNLSSAETMIRKAIELDPYSVASFAQLSRVKIEQKEWQAAIEAAEQGLALDPENVSCTNYRALALVKTGNKSAANEALRSALQKAPEDASSHANMGWSLLEQGNPKEAMNHFREALRLEPSMEWARLGIVEAMKSQYFIYRIMLSWFLWTSRLKGNVMMYLMIGGYIGYRAILSLANQFPDAAPFLMPLIILYIAFAIMTWISVPMFNLVLRTSRFGRLALSDEEKQTSNWVGACLLIAVACIVTYFFAPKDSLFLIAALAAGLMTPIAGTYYSSDEGWPRTVHRLLLLTMLMLVTVVLVGCFGEFFLSGTLRRTFGALVGLTGIPLLYFALGSQFAVGFLVSAKPHRGGKDNSKMIWKIGIGVLALLGIGFFLLSVLLYFGAQKYEQQQRANNPMGGLTAESTE